MERERERGHDFHGSPRGLPWKDSGGLPAPAAARSGVGATATRGTNATWIIILGSTVGDLWDREEGRERGRGGEGEVMKLKAFFLRVAGRSGMDARRALCPPRGGRDGGRRE